MYEKKIAGKMFNKKMLEHWRPQPGGKGGATAMPSPRSFEWVRIQTTKYQTHLPLKFIFSSDFGRLILKMLKIKMLLMRVLFTWIVQFSFRSFVDSVCSALLICLFALLYKYYLRSGAGNIASDQTHLFHLT